MQRYTYLCDNSVLRVYRTRTHLHAKIVGTISIILQIVGVQVISYEQVMIHNIVPYVGQLITIYIKYVFLVQYLVSRFHGLLHIDYL